MPLAVAVVLTLVCATAPAQDPVRALQRAFRPAADPSDAFDARVAALDAIPVVEDAQVVDALLAGWGRVHQEARSIERERRRPAGNPMPSVSEMGDRVALNRCLRLTTRIEAMLAGAAPAALERVVDAVLEPGLALQARTALAPLASGLGSSAVARAVSALADSKRPDDAWVALRAVESIGEPARSSGAALEAWLSHRDAVVRVQSARTIAAVRHRAGASALIGRLTEEQGRVRTALVAALEKLTGRELGTAEASWRAWWEAEGEAFVRGDVLRVKPPRNRERRDDGATRGAYFGIPQDGRSVLYLVDFSKSMRARMRGQSGSTRWDECVRELGQAIERLGPDRTFNIVVFAQRVVAWSDSQMPADARNVAAAKSWIDALELELGTAVFEAFEVAFALGGPGLAERYFEPAIDTIFFLSDGLPTIRYPESPRRLSQDDPELVLALVRRRNPFRSIAVHAVMLGRQGGGPFMRRLAAENGGIFVAR